MDFGDLSRLVYRDMIKQKHSERSRLNKELQDNKQQEDQAKAAHAKSLEEEKLDRDVLSDLLVDHLLQAT